MQLEVKALTDPRIRKLLSEFDGYLVGGLVRDQLLGREAKDIDICTLLKPDEISVLLKTVCSECGCSFREQGKSYGVFVVRLSEDLEIELAAARRDFNHDGRHCEVEYLNSIEEDLKRRDLTINALAVDIDGNIVDPCNGLTDLKEKVINFVGKAEDRIAEDNLRAWRALRFSYQLGFNLVPGTVAAIYSYTADSITRQKPMVLSAERMQAELVKILNNYSYTSRIHWELLCRLLATTGLPILSLIDLQQPKDYHEFDVYTHTERVLRFAPRNLKLQLACLLHEP